MWPIHVGIIATIFQWVWLYMLVSVCLKSITCVQVVFVFWRNKSFFVGVATSVGVITCVSLTTVLSFVVGVVNCVGVAAQTITTCINVIRRC